MQCTYHGLGSLQGGQRRDRLIGLGLRDLVTEEAVGLLPVGQEAQHRERVLELRRRPAFPRNPPSTHIRNDIWGRSKHDGTPHLALTRSPGRRRLLVRRLERIDLGANLDALRVSGSDQGRAFRLPTQSHYFSWTPGA